MSNLPPNYNLITQPFGLDFQESLNKSLYDNTVVAPYTTAFADFYAIMPSANASPIAAAGDVAFPTNGPSSNTDITRFSTTQFTLGPIGTYQVYFSVPVDISGQLVLTLNNVEVPSTLVGRLAASTPIIGNVMLTTVAANSKITVRNPVGSANALPISVSAGGVGPVSAHLVITRMR
jgi:hypothetical protein